MLIYNCTLIRFITQTIASISFAKLFFLAFILFWCSASEWKFSEQKRKLIGLCYNRVWRAANRRGKLLISLLTQCIYKVFDALTDKIKQHLNEFRVCPWLIVNFLFQLFDFFRAADESHFDVRLFDVGIVEAPEQRWKELGIEILGSSGHNGNWISN